MIIFIVYKKSKYNHRLFSSAASPATVSFSIPAVPR